MVCEIYLGVRLSLFVFFFKQKTAYEMRISDWSSDVCSSDLLPALPEVPSARYHDKDFYDLEMQHVFRKTWLSAAHVSELPKQGSYKLFEQMGLSIIISRGTDDKIRAFRNVCQHRGAALVTEPSGTARRFVCPYHARGYSAEGGTIGQASVWGR